MKQWNRIALATVGALALVAGGCEPEQPETVDPGTGTTGQTVDVAQNINQDTTWKAGNTYVLKSQVFVGGGATLTVEPGVTVKGDGKVALVITTEGKLVAEGTKDKPIVFTSNKPAGSRVSGDWQGLIMLGKAPINVAGGTATAEGFPAGTPGIVYGGSVPKHDCGSLKYVRIEFAGYKLTVDKETNGLTMGGCGSDTKVDYLQVHLGNDDGVELFGGTANLKHVLVTQAEDDGFDWDFGYQGKVQFLIVQQSPTLGDKGFEADNNDPNYTLLPRSKPTVYNATLVGGNLAPKSTTQPKSQGGMHLRRGTAGTIRNAVVEHFNGFAVDVDSTDCVTLYDNGELSVRNTVFFNNQNNTTSYVMAEASPGNDGGFDEAAKLMEAVNANVFADPKLERATDLLNPSFKPQAGSPVLTAGATPPNDGFFDTSATFAGAIGTDDWTAGWTAFPAN